MWQVGSAPVAKPGCESLPRTAHFHANDPNLRGPGLAAIYIPPNAHELLKGGYNGWGSVEVFDTNVSPVTLAAESMKNLRSAFR